MNYIAITQRVSNDNAYQERRDCLDQKWIELLHSCNLTPIIIPNNLQIAICILKSIKINGVLLTGGNTLSILGGDAPERDIVEHELIKYAESNNLPIIGICRGMQILQEYEGQENFIKVNNHITKSQQIKINGLVHDVNSYHNYATFVENDEKWNILARSEDGVIKAIEHKIKRFYGLMWHPERITPFREYDLYFFNKVFIGNN